MSTPHPNPLIRRALETILQSVFPPVCLACDAPLFGRQKAFLCEKCHGRMAFIGDGACRFCGAPAGEYAQLGKGCAQCRPHALRFTRAAAVVAYDSPAREIVHAFKFHGDRRLAEPLGLMMAQRILEAEFPPAFSCVIPVPLHQRRLWERGYNQSELLARRLARLLQAPLENGILERNRETQAQALLRFAERITNPVGAFRATARLPGGAVLLVDDVLTTGTTVSECAGVLRAAGAERVYVIAFAR